MPTSTRTRGFGHVAVTLAAIPLAGAVPALASSGTPLTSSSALPVIADDEPRYAWNILTGAGGGLVLTRLDGSDEVRLATDVAGVHKRNDWSPDGEHIVFVDETTETIWIAHLDGSPSTQLPGCDHDGCDQPAWSPDGERIAYSRAAPGMPGVVGPAWVQVEVLDLDTGEVTVVVRLERPLLADVPRWSPDGSELLIGVDRMDDDAMETGAALAVVPADGGELRYLTEFERYGYLGDWSRVTGEIVFGTQVRDAAADFDPDETWEIWAVQPDGSGLRQVTHSAAGVQYKGAKWTPDGTAILAWDQGGVQIDPATGEVTRLTSPADTGAPRLRPTS